MNSLISFFNTPGWRWVLSPFLSLMYFLKGNGWVPVRYHAEFRAWEFRVGGIVYLSAGPGWAYQRNYLIELLTSTSLKFYKPKKGDCIIDLGAGLGEETVIYAQEVGSTGSVLSMEANPITAGALKYACDKNRFTQVHVFTLAIGPSAGTVEIEDNPESYVGNTVGKTDTHLKTFEVKSLTIGEFVEMNRLTKIDLLKSNIEGAEQFLTAGDDTWVSKLRSAAISCHDFRFVNNHESEFYATKAKIIAFFQKYDFEITLNNTGHAVNDCMVYVTRKK